MPFCSMLSKLNIYNECLKLLYGEKQPQMAAFSKSAFITKHDDDEHRRRGLLRSQS